MPESRKANERLQTPAQHEAASPILLYAVGGGQWYSSKLSSFL